MAHFSDNLVATTTEKVLSWTLSWQQGPVHIAGATGRITESHVQAWVGVVANGGGLESTM